MSIDFAAAMGHAPGWVAWTERATASQRDGLAAGVAALKTSLEAAKPDVIVALTCEHWTNFFLDHVSAFCVGCGESAMGPVEPWMKMPRTPVPGDPTLAQEIIAAAYDAGFEPSFSHELQLDHGTMVPLSFLTPGLGIPVVPVFFNTLAPPQPQPARCFAFGEALGAVAQRSGKRVALIATGGLSHDPGEKGHGRIDSDFDRAFLDQMARGDTDRLRRYTIAELAEAGVGTVECITWIALAGALSGALGAFKGEVLAYEPVTGWATGMGVMRLEAA